MSSAHYLLVAALASALLLEEKASAHELGFSRAYLMNPEGISDRADSRYQIRWLDSDTPIPTGTVTIDLFYTREMPPTYVVGARPQGLTGTMIASNIAEADPTNSVEWDLLGVPSGHYWLWSSAKETPGDPSLPNNIISFAPGIVTVAHPGEEDLIGPAVLITSPKAFDWFDHQAEIGYTAHDPDSTARVRLEMHPTSDPAALVLLADDLPATSRGLFTFDVSERAEGPWTMRATIYDARGRTFVAYGLNLLQVVHPTPLDPLPLPEMGARDAGEHAARGGCACLERRSAPLPSAGLILCAGVFMALRSRRSPRPREARWSL